MMTQTGQAKTAPAIFQPSADKPAYWIAGDRCRIENQLRGETENQKVISVYPTLQGDIDNET